MTDMKRTSIRALFGEMGKLAEERGANAIVGLEIDINPFAEKEGKRGILFIGKGTMALLE